MRMKENKKWKEMEKNKERLTYVKAVNYKYWAEKKGNKY